MALKQRKPLVRTAFARQRVEGPSVQIEDKPWAAVLAGATLRALGMPASYAGSTTQADPKSVEHRCAALLEMARGRPCLLLVPGVCTHRIDQTVACHSNLSIHGKAGARKADDCYSCWGCAACHRWLDQGGEGAALKELTFMGGHSRQVLAWRLVAADRTEPPRFRRAAQRALTYLNATPLHQPPDRSYAP